MYICNCIVHVSRYIIIFFAITVNCLYLCFFFCFRALSTQQGGYVRVTNLYYYYYYYCSVTSVLDYGLTWTMFDGQTFMSLTILLSSLVFWTISTNGYQPDDTASFGQGAKYKKRVPKQQLDSYTWNTTWLLWLATFVLLIKRSRRYRNTNYWKRDFCIKQTSGSKRTSWRLWQ